MMHRIENEKTTKFSITHQVKVAALDHFPQRSLLAGLLICLPGFQPADLGANYIGSAMGMYGEGEVAGFIASVIGAMLLLFLYRVFRGKRA